MADGPTLEKLTLEKLLRRDRAITLAGLVLLCTLAWLYLATGAGMRAMIDVALFPHHGGDVMPAMDGMAMADAAPAPTLPAWPAGYWALTIAMWWIMMIAMMTPSAAPAILLYARVHRHAGTKGQVDARLAPTGAFAVGYLLVWLGFAIAATLAYRLLLGTGIVSAATMGSRSAWLSAALLLAVGLYQLSPLKNLCLAHCRAPASFLSRHWRPGARGALRLGAMHGAFCLGCCWLLMALLFVGGVMNLVWIAALTALVMIEKLAPSGPWVGRGVGAMLIAWGLATLFV